MIKSLLVLVLLSTNVYAEFQTGSMVQVNGELIRNRRTGEFLGLVQNYTVTGKDQEGKEIRNYEDSFGYYILSKNKKCKEGHYQVVYLLKDGFTADQIPELAEIAGEAVFDRFGKEFEKNKKSLGADLWKKLKVDNWDDRTLAGKIWRWPLAIVGFAGGKLADGTVTAGKWVYAAAGTGLADLKEIKIEKAMTRAGLVEFKNNVVCVKNKVFQTIVSQF
ncbi:MAG: hypothetical protein KA715_14245 [Xanthomonadaceae bacterium]|nr:hypothetical protein [Xanthomonadaceae bacterium]